MERQLWKSIVCLLREVHKAQHQWRCRYSVLEIVEIWFWAVIHDRPVSWACQRRSWPIWDHRRVLPSNATMSRRLRTKEVKTLISAMENRVLRQAGWLPHSRSTLCAAGPRAGNPTRQRGTEIGRKRDGGSLATISTNSIGLHPVSLVTRRVSEGRKSAENETANRSRQEALLQ